MQQRVLSAPRVLSLAGNLGNRRLYSVKKLTHVNAEGKANMVDVGAKQSTRRSATAFGVLQFSEPGIAAMVESNSLKKGDVLAVARVAGIMAAKNTSNLIPLCHPLAISKIDTKLEVDTAHNRIQSAFTVQCTGQTGVEMEALVGTSITLNTIYDMCKAVDRHMEIQSIRVVEKTGGSHDFSVNSLK